MADPQYLSMDPHAGEPIPPPDLRIGPDPFGAHGGQTGPDRPVTLGDLWDDPEEAIQRIGTILKRDATDPKTWFTLAAMYFGPRAMGYAIPGVSQAVRGAVRGTVRGAAAVGDVVSPDVIGIVSPRVGRAVETAQRLRQAMPAPPAVAGEPPPASIDPATSVGPMAAGSTVAVEPPAPGGPPTGPRTLNEAFEAAMAARRATAPGGRSAPVAQSPAPARPGAAPPTSKPVLSAAETELYLQMRQQGKTDGDARDTLTALRQIAGGLPTDAQVQAAVQGRNARGRWQ